MLVNTITAKKYRGAYIYIVNYWQDFVIVIFYRGRFYSFRSVTDKRGKFDRFGNFIRGEYTNEEYIIVLENIFKDAHKFIDAIKIERSVLFRIKRSLKLFIQKSNVKRQRKTGGVPQGAGQIGKRQESSAQGLQIPQRGGVNGKRN